MIVIKDMWASDPPPYKYAPQEDITLHELAEILPVLIAAQEKNSNVSSNKTIPDSLTLVIDNLPPEQKRHFQQD